MRDPRDIRPVILSYGGGVQTVALCCLVADGRLPRPERIVIADTGREASTTWQYTDAYMRPLMRERCGLEIEIAPHKLARVDLMDTQDLDERNLMLGLYLAGGGRMVALCSSEWKRDPIRKWLRLQGYGRNNPVRMWLGISIDELQRARTSNLKWVEHWWPLIMDIPTSRAGCVAIIERMGLPIPERSSCWMCPNRGDQQWQRLKAISPQDFAQAVEVDRYIRTLPRFETCYLHRSCQPLDQVEFERHPGQSTFADLECNSGECWV